MKIQIQGILNCTPDSFSDGGKYSNLQSALSAAKNMIREGADIIDIGGESTGPNSKYVSLQEELNRVIPAIKEIRKHSDIKLSIDTCKSQVADAAIQAGANIINDVTAGNYDPKIFEVSAKHQCEIILMHSKDQHPRTTIQNTNYRDIIKTISTFFQKKIREANKFGIKTENIIIDPGIGHFLSSDPIYSYEVISRLAELKKNFPKNKILVGISRKSFMGGSLNDRDNIAIQLHRILAINGVDILRVHNVALARSAIDFRN